MKIKYSAYFLAALLITITSSVPLNAQGKCAPPVNLPSGIGPNIFNAEQEGYLGDVIAEQIQKKYRVIEDPEVVLYLAHMGEKLSAHLPIQVKLRFLIVDAPEANAWVIAGGHIFVTRKLVALARNEDEVA